MIEPNPTRIIVASQKGIRTFMQFMGYWESLSQEGLTVLVTQKKATIGIRACGRV